MNFEKLKRKKKQNSIPMHSTAAWADGDWRALAGAMGLPLPEGIAPCPSLFPMAAAPPAEAEKERNSGSRIRPTMRAATIGGILAAA